MIGFVSRVPRNRPIEQTLRMRTTVRWWRARGVEITADLLWQRIERKWPKLSEDQKKYVFENCDPPSRKFVL